MPSALLEAHKALYAAAKAAVPVPVFDSWGAAAGSPLPYVCLDTFLVVQSDTKTDKARDVTARFHVWSEQNSRKEAAEIAGLLEAAIDGASLAVPGFDLVWCRFETETSVDDPGGSSQLVSTYSLRLNPAP